MTATLESVGAIGTTAGGLLVPERVAGRTVWMESAMRDVIHKLHFGDPVKGWEGDTRLGVYWHPQTQRWEVWRVEDDGVPRFVCRSAPGVPFDDRLIDALCQWDRRRRRKSLADEVIENNERQLAQQEQHLSEMIREELGPRLHHAVLRDAGWNRRNSWGG